ncbi:hypothetical protein FACS189449_13040 [Alphaproteobacteria bacterium]|nr:hypothetical protein FACS189449_13040 [Alphaproteobacteria bacterium]
MKIYSYFAFCAFFLLIGCSPLELAPDYSNDTSIDAQLRSKAIVVVRTIDGDRSGGFMETVFRPSLCFWFVHLEKKSNYVVRVDTTSDDEWNSKLSKEGIYGLSSIVWGIGNQEITVSGFNIYVKSKKGEVVYIGDFVFYPSRGTIEIKNCFEKAKKSIGKTMPELATRLKENIALEIPITR